VAGARRIEHGFGRTERIDDGTNRHGFNLSWEELGAVEEEELQNE
jgi:hypothetical protein